MRLPHYRTWNMLRNSGNGKNEKYTLQDLDYVKETLKIGKGHKHNLTTTIPKNTQKRKKLEIHSREN